jgi:hypothetical protein
LLLIAPVSLERIRVLSFAITITSNCKVHFSVTSRNTVGFFPILV